MILYCYQTYSAAVVHKAVDLMVEYYLIVVSRKILYTTNTFCIISEKKKFSIYMFTLYIYRVNDVITDWPGVI